PGILELANDVAGFSLDLLANPLDPLAGHDIQPPVDAPTHGGVSATPCATGTPRRRLAPRRSPSPAGASVPRSPGPTRRTRQRSAPFGARPEIPPRRRRHPAGPS